MTQEMILKMCLVLAVLLTALALAIAGVVAFRLRRASLERVRQQKASVLEKAKAVERLAADRQPKHAHHRKTLEPSRAGISRGTARKSSGYPDDSWHANTLATNHLVMSSALSNPRDTDFWSARDCGYSSSGSDGGSLSSCSDSSSSSSCDSSSSSSGSCD